jgi:hypothetical protein
MADPQSLKQLLRGPFILLVAASSFAVPYIILNFSVYWIIFGLLELGLAAFGCLLLAHDVKTVLFSTYEPQFGSIKTTLKELKRKVDVIVMDDVFRSIFGPQGWIACSFAVCAGTILMYGFPCITDEHRRQMVQALFGISRRQAETILLQQGGYALFLPLPLQDWLRHHLTETLPGNAQKYMANNADNDWTTTHGTSPVPSTNTHMDDSSSSTTTGLSADDLTQPLIGLRIQLSSPLADAIIDSETTPTPNPRIQPEGCKRRLTVNNSLLI